MLPTPPARDRLAAQLERAWPGLIHFGRSPLVLHAGFATRRIRVCIPGKDKILHLQRISIHSADGNPHACGQFTLSSRHPSSREAKDVLDGGWIHTARQDDPTWSASFDKEIACLSIRVFNRVGTWAHRAYGICVNIEGPQRSAHFDTLDAGHLGFVAAGLLSRAQAALLKFAESSPPAALARRAFGIQEALHALRESAFAHHAPEADWPSARGRLAQALVDFFSTASKPESEGHRAQLRALLCELAGLIDSLVPKSAHALQPAHVERGLAALSLTAIVLLEGRADLAHVEEYGHIVSEAEPLLQVEGAINQMLRDLEAPGMEMPMLFRAHGLSGSSLHSDPQSYLVSMQEVAAALSGRGYVAGICYGTLLGAVREKGFIPHDDDVDMVVELKESAGEQCRDELEAIRRALVQDGFKADFCSGHDFLKVKSRKGGRYVDLFPISPDADGQHVWMFMQQLKMRPVRRSVVLPLEIVRLLGVDYLAPRRVDEFLEDRYGADWRIPQRIVGTRSVSAPVQAVT